MRVSRVASGLVALVLGLTSCGLNQNPKDDAKRAFIRWNALAVAHDKQAANYVCRGIKVDDGTQLIPSNHPGFVNFKDLDVAFADGNRAEINFHEMFDGVGQSASQAVYLGLVKQSGNWKVCGVQTTADGGFG